MTVQLIRKIRDRQPLQPVRIDYSNPISKNIVFAFEAGVDNRNLVTSVDGEPLLSGVSHSAGLYGRQFSYSGSQVSRSCSFGLLRSLCGATSATWDILVYFNSANPTTHFFAQWDSSLLWLFQANAGSLVWVAAEDDLGNRRRWDLSSAFPSSGWYRIIASWQGGANKVLLINGIDKSGSLSVISNVANQINTTNTKDYLQIGMSDGGTALAGAVCFARAWSRGLSLPECKSLHENPWQIFEPETIPLFYSTGTGPVTHPTTGDVVGNTATVTGSALREAGAQTHPSTGDVVGNTATVTGTALRYRAHATTGVVAGLTSNVTGTALRYRLHETTGTPTGLTSIVTGSAVNEPAAGVHETDGVITGTTGSVSGSALHIGVHRTTGVLAGFSAEVIGAAQRSGAVIVHDTSGVLAGYDSVVTGAATNQGSMTLTPADIQAIVAAIKAEIMPVNIVRVNGDNVDGDGSDSNPWGPV